MVLEIKYFCTKSDNTNVFGNNIYANRNDHHLNYRVDNVLGGCGKNVIEKLRSIFGFNMNNLIKNTNINGHNFERNNVLGIACSDVRLSIMDDAFTDTVRLLCENGANVNNINYLGLTPVTVLFKNKPEKRNFLLDVLSEYNIDLNSKNAMGDAPIVRFFSSNLRELIDTEVLEKLRSLGGEFCSTDNNGYYGCTVLMAYL